MVDFGFGFGNKEICWWQSHRFSDAYDVGETNTHASSYKGAESFEFGAGGVDRKRMPHWCMKS
jgi:hypothetical protein